jgi:hypothetical protein
MGEVKRQATRNTKPHGQRPTIGGTKRKATYNAEQPNSQRPTTRLKSKQNANSGRTTLIFDSLEAGQANHMSRFVVIPGHNQSNFTEDYMIDTYIFGCPGWRHPWKLCLHDRTDELREYLSAIVKHPNTLRTLMEDGMCIHIDNVLINFANETKILRKKNSQGFTDVCILRRFINDFKSNNDPAFFMQIFAVLWKILYEVIVHINIPGNLWDKKNFEQGFYVNYVKCVRNALRQFSPRPMQVGGVDNYSRGQSNSNNAQPQPGINSSLRPRPLNKNNSRGQSNSYNAQPQPGEFDFNANGLSRRLQATSLYKLENNAAAGPSISLRPRPLNKNNSRGQSYSNNAQPQPGKFSFNANVLSRGLQATSLNKQQNNAAAGPRPRPLNKNNSRGQSNGYNAEPQPGEFAFNANVLSRGLQATSLNKQQNNAAAGPRPRPLNKNNSRGQSNGYNAEPQPGEFAFNANVLSRGLQATSLNKVKNNAAAGPSPSLLNKNNARGHSNSNNGKPQPGKFSFNANVLSRGLQATSLNKVKNNAAAGPSPSLLNKNNARGHSNSNNGKPQPGKFSFNANVLSRGLQATSLNKVKNNAAAGPRPRPLNKNNSRGHSNGYNAEPQPGELAFNANVVSRMLQATGLNKQKNNNAAAGPSTSSRPSPLNNYRVQANSTGSSNSSKSKGKSAFTGTNSNGASYGHDNMDVDEEYKYIESTFDRLDLRAVFDKLGAVMMQTNSNPKVGFQNKKIILDKFRQTVNDCLEQQFITMWKVYIRIVTSKEDHVNVF